MEQIVRSVGTVSSAAKVAASFSVAGTVAAVPVKIGDQVTAGQTLANADPAALNNAVDSANSAVTKAQDTLATDQASQTATGTSTSDTGSTAGTDRQPAPRVPIPQRIPVSPRRACGPPGAAGAVGVRGGTRRRQ